MSKIIINRWNFEHTMLPRQQGAGVDPSLLDQAVELAATNGDYGSLVLGVAAETAFDEILAACRTGQPDAMIDGCLVAPTVAGGVETILGVLRDPVFGPIVMFGLGGIFVETLEDVTFRAAPIDGSQARVMIESVAAYPLLIGLRGRPPPTSPPSRPPSPAIEMTCPWRLVQFPGSRSGLLAELGGHRRQIRARLRAPRAVRHRRPVQVPARLKHRLHPEAKSAEVLRWK